VTDKDHRYLSNLQEREEGGTPNILGSIRAGLVFQLKYRVGVTTIEGMGGRWERKEGEEGRGGRGGREGGKERKGRKKGLLNRAGLVLEGMGGDRERKGGEEDYLVLTPGKKKNMILFHVPAKNLKKLRTSFWWVPKPRRNFRFFRF
jgi:hypothetical protein